MSKTGGMFEWVEMSFNIYWVGAGWYKNACRSGLEVRVRLFMQSPRISPDVSLYTK
jgi:hypothetical protein